MKKISNEILNKLILEAESGLINLPNNVNFSEEKKKEITAVAIFLAKKSFMFIQEYFKDMEDYILGFGTAKKYKNIIDLSYSKIEDIAEDNWQKLIGDPSSQKSREFIYLFLGIDTSSIEPNELGKKKKQFAQLLSSKKELGNGQNLVDGVPGTINNELAKYLSDINKDKTINPNGDYSMDSSGILHYVSKTSKDNNFDIDCSKIICSSHWGHSLSTAKQNINFSSGTVPFNFHIMIISRNVTKESIKFEKNFMEDLQVIQNCVNEHPEVKTFEDFKTVFIGDLKDNPNDNSGIEKSLKSDSDEIMILGDKIKNIFKNSVSSKNKNDSNPFADYFEIYENFSNLLEVTKGKNLIEILRKGELEEKAPEVIQTGGQCNSRKFDAMLETADPDVSAFGEKNTKKNCELVSDVIIKSADPIFISLKYTDSIKNETLIWNPSVTNVNPENLAAVGINKNNLDLINLMRSLIPKGAKGDEVYQKIYNMPREGQKKQYQDILNYLSSIYKSKSKETQDLFNQCNDLLGKLESDVPGENKDSQIKVVNMIKNVFMIPNCYLVHRYSDRVEFVYFSDDDFKQKISSVENVVSFSNMQTKYNGLSSIVCSFDVNFDFSAFENEFENNEIFKTSVNLLGIDTEPGKDKKINFKFNLTIRYKGGNDSKHNNGFNHTMDALVVKILP